MIPEGLLDRAVGLYRTDGSLYVAHVVVGMGTLYLLDLFEIKPRYTGFWEGGFELVTTCH